MGSEDYCSQESRITHLETISKKRDEEIASLNKSLGILNSEIMEMNRGLTKLESTFSSLRWLLTASIALFGGIFVFFVTELIKLI